MPSPIETLIATDYRAKGFDCMRRGRPIPVAILARLLLDGLFVEPPLFLIRHWPGAIGMQLRRWLGKATLRRLGKASLIDCGAIINGARNIEIDDYVWIDRRVELDAPVGEITIGRRVHVAPGARISGHGGVYIGDYAAIGANAQILSHSEAIDGGKRLSGPMIIEEYKGMKTAPVRLERDCMIGTGAVVLPGVTVGEGAVVAANSLVIGNVASWRIVMGVPARPVGKRPPVSVPDT